MSKYDIGDQLYFEGKYPEAATIFKECVQEGLELNSSMNYLGCCELRMGNYEYALYWLDQVIERDTTWEIPYNSKSRVYMKQGRFEEAKHCLDLSLKINTDNEDTYFYLGLLFEQLGMLQEAEQAYASSLNIESGQPETLVNYGRVMWKLGKVSKAEEQFLNALNIDPNECDALWNLTHIYIDKNKFTEAILYLSKYIEINNDDIEGLKLMKNIQSKLEQLDKERITSANTIFTL
ncbi:tetratricopeptide repeat protein [Paenibacillus sp. Soil750]|uniref:tetratricopeptide repeat protein n=1 Tax=Paenibacillus sp. Soil750 TaxID=1736398 RepID=UPI0006FC4941|nr:tetratricopeptide repeat protein [Paenibacillus sp. Soil750]KRE61916.1 hypothetical protein ASL11_23705 [Paenibacillus sp. Soil750]